MNEHELKIKEATEYQCGLTIVALRHVRRINEVTDRYWCTFADEGDGEGEGEDVIDVTVLSDGSLLIDL